MSDEVDRHLGISRRDLIKRGAAAGAVIWATPVVQSFATPAFASEGTPVGRAISYVAICYRCNGTHCSAKLDVENGVWEFSSTFETPGCEFSCGAGGDCGHDAGDFLVQTVDDADGEAAVVMITLQGDAADCTFHEGHGVGKCGPGDGSGAVGDCVDGIIDVTGKTMTFQMCDV